MLKNFENHNRFSLNFLYLVLVHEKQKQNPNQIKTKVLDTLFCECKPIREE